MGKSKTSESKSTSYSGSSNPAFMPAANEAIGNVNSVFKANQPGLQQLTDMTHNSVVNPLLSKFQGSLGGAGQAQDYYKGVLSSGGNPYLQGMIDQTGRDVTNNVNSQFELNGRYGSDAHGYGLSRGLADSENALRYQDFGDTEARKAAAASALAGGNQADIASLISAIGANAQLPYAGTSNLSNSLGALFSGGTSTSTGTTYGPNPLWGALGAGLGAAGQIFAGKG